MQSLSPSATGNGPHVTTPELPAALPTAALPTAALPTAALPTAALPTAAGTGYGVPGPAATQPVQESSRRPIPVATGTGPRPPVPSRRFTISFAGDVNFADRTAERLAADPATVFGAATPSLAAADLTMVNLETAIATGGAPEPKEFTFRAPPTALGALKSAGIDVATMANNHGADYGAAGLGESLAAIAGSKLPVIGIGVDEASATEPYRTTVNGVRVVVFAASAVRDRTLDVWTAGAGTPGVASAFDPALVQRVRAAAASGATVLVYLHWGTEFVGCPDDDQRALADEFAAAGATAVVGTHAHVLQGQGWRPDGAYVAYGLGNYLWWRSFGNAQDDNGVLTLTVDGRAVTAADFAPARLDDTGVPVPAAGADRKQILTALDEVRECAGLSATPPG